MPRIYFELQDTQAIYIMRNHFHLWYRIHVITYLATDNFANMLHITKSFDDAIIIYAKEKRTTQAVGESTCTLQPALGLLFFKHRLEVICGTFCYQAL